MFVSVRVNEDSARFIDGVVARGENKDGLNIYSYIADLATDQQPPGIKECIRVNEGDDCCYSFEKGGFVITFAFPYTGECAPLGVTYLLITSVAYPLKLVEKESLIKSLFGTVQEVSQTIHDALTRFLGRPRKR